MLTPDSNVKEVEGISCDERQRIKDFLQGAVYCWCKHNKSEWLSLRIFLGGENYDWQGTPLNVLFEKHRITMGKDVETSVKHAGLDAGSILKQVIKDDKRVFETRKNEGFREYLWTGTERDA